jgi:RNA polymerase sigma-70 factor (ECF subfamily)
MGEHMPFRTVTKGHQVMVETDSYGMFCRQVVEQLNNQEGWQLDDATQEQYVREIVGRVSLDRLMRQAEHIVRHYHHDHGRVQALFDADRPEHIDAWAQVQRDILASAQRHNLATARDPAISRDDIIQIVQAEIVRALPSYRYESSLRTWIYSVTVRRLKRFLRDSIAGKRAVQAESISTLDYEPMDPESIEPIANARALMQQIEQILTHMDGPRTALIFRLHILHDRSAEDIGRYVHLHPSRVRALLVRARQILQADANISTWHMHPDHNSETLK